MFFLCNIQLFHCLCLCIVRLKGLQFYSCIFQCFFGHQSFILKSYTRSYDYQNKFSNCKSYIYKSLYYMKFIYTKKVKNYYTT